MKCVVLAAGYATRLYPLTENFPKPLLKVREKTILDWLLDDLNNMVDISEFIIISNHKFIDFFKKWAQGVDYSDKITVLDDGSTANDNRLGAVKDIAFAIKECDIQDDFMVLAGDNLTDFSLKGFYEYFQEKKKTCIMRHCEKSIEKLKRTGVVVLDEYEKVLSMEEKPDKPMSNWAVPPFYIYSKETAALITKAVNEQVCNVDAPGDFIAWLCENEDVYAYEMPGARYDVGNLESYDLVCREYCGIISNS